MRSKAAFGGTATVLVILALAAYPIFFAARAQAAPPVISSVALPSGAKPISIAIDKNGIFTYYASYTLGDIYKVNSVTGTYATFSPGLHHWISMTYWNNALFLVEELVAANGTVGGLYEFHLSTNTLTAVRDENANAITGVGAAQSSIVTAAQCQQYDYVAGVATTCQRSQSFLYAASGNRFYKISNLSDIPGNPPNAGYHVFPYNCASNSQLCSTGGIFAGMTGDANGNVYATDKLGGQLFVYDAAANSMASYSGFNKPVGVTVIGNDVYVAQNVLNGGIVDFKADTHLTSSVGSVGCGTPFDLKNYNAQIICSSNGPDKQICAVGGTCAMTGEFNYYLAMSPDGKVNAGYLGTSGVLTVTGLVQPAIWTTTSATNYTFTSACNLNYDLGGTLTFQSPCNLVGGTVTTTTATSTSSSTSTTTSSSTSSSSTSSSTSTTTTATTIGSSTTCTSPTTGNPANKFAVGQTVYFVGPIPAIPKGTSFVVAKIYCGNQAGIFGPPYTGTGWNYIMTGIDSYWPEDMLAATYP